MTFVNGVLHKLCYDNAVMENLLGIMKSEFPYLKEFESVENFKKELAKYIDYCNKKRIKAKLKGMSRIRESWI